MAYGLQVYNINGIMTLNTNQRLFRVATDIKITLPIAANTAYYITYPGIVNDGTWIVSWYRPNFLTVTIETGRIKYISTRLIANLAENLPYTRVSILRY
jgi:hypothetical protein